MQIKNKKKILFISILSLFLFNINLNAEEFNITAKEILLDKDNEILIGTGSVKALDSEGKSITADKITYEKKKEFLLAEGNVKISDIEGNIFITDKATYDKIKETIVTYDYTELILKEGYKLVTKNIYYDAKKKILNSKNDSIFTDNDGNIIETTMFQYNIKNNLFSSLGKIKIIDINKNKYFFKELHVDTKKKEMIGSDISVILDEESFGLSKENDPRFSANDIIITKNNVDLSKGVFTVCKIRENKCPPWSLKARKIRHDKAKKTIYYDRATLKVYDIPIFYFPKFFHPDPSVKRQSGFLPPFFTNSTAVGTGSATPYYWAISDDKDLTFTPKFYAKESLLILNEYRQAFANGFLTLDTSYTEGYKNTSKTKTAGSRNHVFANLDIKLNESDAYNSNLSVRIQRTSNDTFFRVHDINTELVNSEDTDLENEIKYSFSSENSYVDISASVFENLRGGKNSDRYEYILPNIIYGKTFFSENFGTLDFESNAFYNQFETNKEKTFLTNNITWNPFSYITKNGFVNKFEGMIRNTNYEAKKTNKYRNEETVNELYGVISYRTSLPMKKVLTNYSKIFSPNLMIKYSPGHMINLSDSDITLDYANLYALNKTSVVDAGLSAILGVEYKINEKKDGAIGKEKLSVAIGQIFTEKNNLDMPDKSSLNKKTSDLIGKIDYNFSKIGKIDYKFSLDENLNDLNYNEISTELNFGKVEFNLEYLEQQNHIGDEHYASSGVTLNFDDNNKIAFSTKKNFKTNSTELYNLSYQYGIDCLTAGLVYRREFYDDVDDLEPKDTLMFTITFVPFGKVNTPAVQQ